MCRKSLGLHMLCVALMICVLLAGASAGTLFQLPQTYDSAGSHDGAFNTEAVAISDLNRDGKLDLVILTECVSENDCHGGLSILLGNGDGSFQSPHSYSTGTTFGVAVIVADVNGDLKPDLIATGPCFDNECQGAVSVLLGNGDGTLQNAQTYGSGGYRANSIVAGDLNGDKELDLIVANQCTNSACNTGTVGVLLGNGDGTFQSAKAYDGGHSQGASIAVHDVNGDDKPDVLYTQSGGVSVLLGNGDGTLQTPELYDWTSYGNLSVQVADVNADGKSDLVVSSSCADTTCSASAVRVLLGNGNGTFQPPVPYNTGARDARSVAVGDLNGDGKLDLIIVHSCLTCNSSPVSLLLGNGDGTFKSPQKYGSGGAGAHSVAIIDVNNDAKPDVIVANACASSSDCTTTTVGVLLGTSPVQTNTALTSNRNPAAYGLAVKWTATVKSIGPNQPTGTVTFKNGTTNLGTATIVAGKAALTKSNLPAGTFFITAVYNGDTNSAKSVSAPMSQIVKRAATATTIQSSLNPSVQGQAVTFTATVTSATTAVTGTVTFTANSVTIGTVALSGGHAQLTTSGLPVGSITIRAKYYGTPNIAGSTKALTQIVN